ncbi:hypothetical protein NLJ89_g12015 [Agrocybe chaxingu]|uniref:Uncharacterized protein n=1 Tax=Agrocybe chaxingu TaxID=84603 RepID=A0A9W8JV96_9AGAR|nr:hypothetical protein NLJ89_g12015 [Agrocybe chaxingu]
MYGRDLEREVFGGSESELSSDEDEEIQQQQQQQHQQQHQAPKPRAPKPREEYDSSGGDSEDDYVQERPGAGKTKKRTAKKARVDGGEPKALQRKRKRKQPVEVDLSELPPQQGAFLSSLAKVARSRTNDAVTPSDPASKLRLDMRIDEILKPKKANRPRKKKTNDEVLDTFADDEVARLREAMSNAAEEDIRSNQEKQPATAKLKFHFAASILSTLSAFLLSSLPHLHAPHPY